MHPGWLRRASLTYNPVSLTRRALPAWRLDVLITGTILDHGTSARR
jgi:hypothetical protein